MQKKLRRFQKELDQTGRRQVRRLKILGRHPVITPLVTFLLLCGLGAIIVFGLLHVHLHADRPNAWSVIVSYDHKQEVVPSREPTVGALIQKLGIVINKGDVVEPSQTTRINQDDFRINVYRAVPVTLIDGQHKIFAYSAATTPRAVAAQAGLNLYPEDEVSSQPVDNFLEQDSLGEVVHIKPSVPLRLIVYGSPIITRTHSATVADMLVEKHISLHPGDTVQPALSSKIRSNEQVFVLHKGTKIVTQSKQIPMPIQYVDDKHLSAGTTAVRQYGSPGIILITYQLDKKTGKKIKLQSVVVQEAVKQIVARGTAPVSGSLGTWLRKLRDCESGGNYQDNTGNGYYGAYQFSISTWDRWNTGYSRADLAPPSVQDATIVKNTNASGGGLASQNPGCYYSTGISAFPPGS